MGEPFLPENPLEVKLRCLQLRGTLLRYFEAVTSIGVLSRLG